MLNPHLFLNPKLFNEDAEKKATRDGFGTALVKLGDENPNVVVLTADLSESTRTEEFAKKYPERFFEMGVAEQNMATVAAGMGISGKTAFISSYATFSPGRNWEQIRTTIVYNKSNVKIAGHHAGLMTGPDGATHQATEDIAMMRALPDILVTVPCDSIEGEKATLAIGKIKDASYIRFSRDKSVVMTTEKTPFSLSKAQVFWVSSNPQVAIIGTGYMVYYCLLAAKELEKMGIETLVVNNATIKPLDEKLLLDVAAQAGAVVTVEDHQVTGGLGGALSELFAKHTPVPMEFIGLQNTFGESGKPDELIEKYGMGKDAIIAAVKKVIKRK
ncbi:MAG TPA: transketolase C-terminal domain-containing protein [Patescibacteria group bacterium]|nr:transketolase C-terminal domain-containing protein [Patescibacteria group bacterium]